MIKDLANIPGRMRSPFVEVMVTAWTGFPQLGQGSWCGCVTPFTPASPLGLRGHLGFGFAIRAGNVSRKNGAEQADQGGAEDPGPIAATANPFVRPHLRVVAPVAPATASDSI
ncbi:hypothetical protein AB0O67_11755 [Streptomyces sp. NPDC086077]|uniref:hypothetical protein n=1 Tax=Streptomyces sp. NPDC086077 TaxID=3154862 RepID=UPI00341E858B